MSFIRQLFLRKMPTTTSQPASLAPTPLVGFHLSEARDYLASNEYQQALWHCQEALALDPTQGDAYRLRGAIRYYLNDDSGALADLRYSLTLP